MKKIKKIEIRVNGKIKSIPNDYKVSNLLRDINIPLKKWQLNLIKK